MKLVFHFKKSITLNKQTKMMYCRVNHIRPNLVTQDHTVDTQRFGAPRYSMWAFEER